MWEYRIIVGHKTECQMKLNQWEKLYEMEIISMVTDKDGLILILVKRKRK